MTCDELVADPALEGVSEELALLVRVFGIPQEEILVRVIEAGVDSVLSDPEVSDIVNRLHRLDARRGQRTIRGEVEAPAAAESRKASTAVGPRPRNSSRGVTGFRRSQPRIPSPMPKTTTWTLRTSPW